MPVHDWTKPDAGLLHHFHQPWSVELCNALNQGVLPAGIFALIERKAIGVEPDVMAFTRPRSEPDMPEGGVAAAPP
ncbi:hypothetical protein J0H58_16305 [bacterium]|nr:hypothetical protein [bacterium]